MQTMFESIGNRLLIDHGSKHGEKDLAAQC